MVNSNSNSIKYLKIFLISVISVFLLVITFQIFEDDSSNIGIKETNYSISDVENFNVTTSDKCPNESSFPSKTDFISKEGEKFTSCDYQYLCNKNTQKCFMFNAPMGLSYYSTSLSHADNIVTGQAFDRLDNGNKMILIGCSEDRLKDHNCSTDRCVNDSDCLSNSCVNNVCMANKENPILLCRPVKENSEIKVKCLASLEEPCQKDTDCAENAVCSKKSNVCIVENIPEKIDSSTTSKTVYIIIAIVSVLIIIFLVYSLWKHRKSDDN